MCDNPTVMCESCELMVSDGKVFPFKEGMRNIECTGDRVRGQRSLYSVDRVTWRGVGRMAKQVTSRSVSYE